jgi:hypothetical protein
MRSAEKAEEEESSTIDAFNTGLLHWNELSTGMIHTNFQFVKF